jgi:hypothetical protein
MVDNQTRNVERPTLNAKRKTPFVGAGTGARPYGINHPLRLSRAPQVGCSPTSQGSFTRNMGSSPAVFLWLARGG